MFSLYHDIHFNKTLNKDLAFGPLLLLMEALNAGLYGRLQCEGPTASVWAPVCFVQLLSYGDYCLVPPANMLVHPSRGVAASMGRPHRKMTLIDTSPHSFPHSPSANFGQLFLF